MPTLFEAAGGEPGLHALAQAWHARVMSDDVVSHAFSHGVRPDHTERLAAYWVEALGGPPRYSQRYGDESVVVRLHSGNGEHDEMNRRAIDCFDRALSDAGLDRDEHLRRTLHDYFAWAATTTMNRYHASADDVPGGLRIPKWTWSGLLPPAPGTWPAPTDRAWFPGDVPVTPAGPSFDWGEEVVPHEPAPAPLEPPTRGSVFGEVWWRSIALASLAGGIFGVGLVIVVAVLAVVDEPPDFGGDVAGAVVSIAIFSFMIGFFVGLAIGITVGFALGCVLAATLVPYPGQAGVVVRTRVSATGLVLVWFLIATAWIGGSPTSGWFLLLAGIPIVATWFVSPRVTRWYVKRMEAWH